MEADNHWIAYNLAAKGQLEPLQEYLVQSFYPGHDYSMAICAAAGGGHTDIVRWLVGSPHINHKQNHYEAFTVSAMHGHLDILKLLFAESRLTPVEYSNTISRVLAYAARRNHRAIVEFCLVDPATDPYRHKGQSFNWALYRNNYVIAALLLDDPRMKLDSAIYDIYITEPHIYRNRCGLYSAQRQNESVARCRGIKGELIERTWHPDRVWDWCFDEEEKRELTSGFPQEGV